MEIGDKEEREVLVKKQTQINSEIENKKRKQKLVKEKHLKQEITGDSGHKD